MNRGKGIHEGSSGEHDSELVMREPVVGVVGVGRGTSSREDVARGEVNRHEFRMGLEAVSELGQTEIVDGSGQAGLEFDPAIRS